jgi:hypothetical protein
VTPIQRELEHIIRWSWQSARVVNGYFDDILVEVQAWLAPQNLAWRSFRSRNCAQGFSAFWAHFVLWHDKTFPLAFIIPRPVQKQN